MCNLDSETKGQAAIRGLFRVVTDRTGNMPSFPAIFSDQMAPIVRNAEDGGNWPSRAGVCRDRRSTAACQSRRSAMFPARTGADGCHRRTVASFQRPRSANMLMGSRARFRHGLPWPKTGLCSRLQDYGRHGAVSEEPRARRWMVSMNCLGS